MAPISEIIFSGFVSKVVNDIVDVSKDKIRKAVRNRNTKHQNIESQIYNVIVNALNKITNNRYENNQDSIYDAAEVLLKSIKENDRDELGSIKTCLRVLDSKVDERECLEFKVSLYEELGKEGYSELFRAILLLLLDQKSRYDSTIYEQLNQKLDEVILVLSRKKDDAENNIKQKVKNRTQEYVDKWEANMFLNDFSEWDESTGINVRLKDVYIEEHLPHFIWGENRIPSYKLKELLTQFIIDEKKENKMLLILGQPGIGKSTLITWIVANFKDKVDNILVYQFATDLKNIDWENTSEKYNISDEILKTLGLSYLDLNNKTLIIDGFDEISIGNNRENVLTQLYWKLKSERTLYNFSLIITCRENYVLNLHGYKYIFLQPWENRQIISFVKKFCDITKNYEYYFGNISNPELFTEQQ